jgi:hypothetical protein
MFLQPISLWPSTLRLALRGHLANPNHNLTFVCAQRITKFDQRAYLRYGVRKQTVIKTEFRMWDDELRKAAVNSPKSISGTGPSG